MTENLTKLTILQIYLMKYKNTIQTSVSKNLMLNFASENPTIPTSYDPNRSSSIGPKAGFGVLSFQIGTFLAPNLYITRDGF